MRKIKYVLADRILNYTSELKQNMFHCDNILYDVYESVHRSETEDVYDNLLELSLHDLIDRYNEVKEIVEEC